MPSLRTSLGITAAALAGVGVAIAVRAYAPDAERRSGNVGEVPTGSAGEVVQVPPATLLTPDRIADASVEPPTAPTAPSADANELGQRWGADFAKVEHWHSASAPRRRTASSVFEERYAGKSLQELIAAEALVRDAYDESRNRAFQDRLDRGIYTPWPAGDAQVAGTTSDPIFQVYVEEESINNKIVWLPQEDYESVYSSSDECFWLKSKVRSMKQQSEPK